MKTLLLEFLLVAPFALPQATTYSARRIQSGTTLPTACTVGAFTDVFIKTNATAASQNYVCTTGGNPGVWTQQGGGTPVVLPGIDNGVVFMNGSHTALSASTDLTFTSLGLADLRHVAIGGSAVLDSLQPFVISETIIPTMAPMFPEPISSITYDIAPTVNSVPIKGIVATISNSGSHQLSILQGVEWDTTLNGIGTGGEDISGESVNVVVGASGTIDQTIGHQIYTEVLASGANIFQFYSGAVVFDDMTTTWTNYYGFYQQGGDFLNGGTLTNFFTLWSPSLGGEATNSYHSWFDEQGVYRVKADNTFNSVYQAIPALYNPQFSKYTPGATNYERIVVPQWSSNIAQIGTEKGGTGTLRELQLIGQDLQIPVLAFAGLGTPANSATAYCSDCTVTSAVNDTCLGSGSGAFAERINGAWSCRQ